jgi:hypothetical protein
MTLVGLDIDATRARAVSGPPAEAPLPLRLAEPNTELALALDLQGRVPVVGRAAWTLCRRLPDCACLDFLPHLGTPRLWRCGRHRLDAAKAMTLVLEQLARGLNRPDGVAAALPAYLSGDQVITLTRLADKARCRLAVTAPTPLAAALGAHDYLPWSGQALVLDVDGHALTWSALLLTDDSARLLATKSLPALGRAIWLGRLLDGVAGRCVRLSRRDPRESAEAEQYLYEQLLQLLDSPPVTGDSIELVVQSAQWYQRLMFSAADFHAFCAPLAQQAVAALKALLLATAAHGPAGVVLLTAAAGSLPGLTAALGAVLEQAPPEPPVQDDEEDFGQGLLPDEPSSGALHVLPADAVARGAHELAARVQQGKLRPGPLQGVPLPAARQASPPRLHTSQDAVSNRQRIPFPGGTTAGTNPAPPQPRRRTRPHDE